METNSTLEILPTEINPFIITPDGRTHPGILYQSKWSQLLSGEHDGYLWWITAGSHPCAYVGIPEGHPMFGADIYSDDFAQPCDRGENLPEFTLSENSDKMKLDIDNGQKRWILGWDYGHAGDYEYRYGDEESAFLGNDKVYSVSDLKLDIARVIDWLKRNK